LRFFRCPDLNCQSKYDKFPGAGRHGNNAEQNQTCPAALIAMASCSIVNRRRPRANLRTA
jgi:hypothetical protein